MSYDLIFAAPLQTATLLSCSHSGPAARFGILRKIKRAVRPLAQEHGDDDTGEKRQRGRADNSESRQRTKPLAR
jgi:hypothetical protein